VAAGTLTQACSYATTTFILNGIRFGPSPAFEISGIAKSQEDIMQMAITFMAVMGGMIFSLAVALLAEEFIFGQVFRLFFSQQAVALKSEQKR
jgi:hypothetical protein